MAKVSEQVKQGGSTMPAFPEDVLHCILIYVEVVDVKISTQSSVLSLSTVIADAAVKRCWPSSPALLLKKRQHWRQRASFY